MQFHYPVAKTVSIWIGTFESEEQFDGLIDAEIVPCFILDVDFHTLCEDAFEGDPQPIRDLLQGFHRWERYVEKAAAVAEGYGVEAANAALVTSKITCVDAPAQWGHFWFLGSFDAANRKSRPRMPSDDW